MAWNFKWAAPGVDLVDAYSMNIVRYRSLIGADGPPYNVVDEEQPFRAGTYLKTVTVDPAEMQLTMLMKGSSSQRLWQSMANLPRLFDPSRTDDNGNFGGRLLVSTPASATSRFLSCLCLSGFQIDEPSLQHKSVEATLTFYANYPYWQSNALHTAEGTPFGKNPKWFSIFPLVLGAAGEHYVEVTVVNAGNVPAYPTIRINGPAGNPQITNQRLPAGTGNFSLTANGGVQLTNNTQSLTINMLNRTVTRNNGVNEVNKLLYTANFWALAPGSNTIRFRINGPPAPTSKTKISITWRDTYSSII